MPETQTPLEKAHAALQAKRAAGELVIRRRSLKQPLKEYFLDLAGVYLNQGCRDAEIGKLRAEAMANLRKARTEGYAAAVQRICWECVGSDADPAPKLTVRDCVHSGCPLHPVRPWQDIKGERSPETAPEDM